MSANTVDSIKVRMYRHGFGDCFLLSFLHKDERVFSMVVDCGIKHNTKSVKVPIAAVIADLKETLKSDGGKPRIDVLLVTHEHWDHVAFFHPKLSPDFFKGFDIGQIWLAWTEDPDDDEAVTINSRLRDGARALHLAATHLHSVEAAESAQFQEFGFGKSVAGARREFNAALDDVLGFYGLAVAKKKSKTSESGIRYKTKPTISAETEVAMNNVISLGKKGGIIFLNPGTKVEAKRLPDGVNAYVLGPPRSKLINKMNPSKGPAKETYLGIDHTGLTGFIDGALQLAGGAKGAAKDADGPFGKGAGLTPSQAESNAYFKQSYFAKGEAYRRIENTWLDAVGPFALQLDGAINNTSLVVAIELEKSGHVILLPGDAQVGSWLSWHEHEWKVKRGDKTEKINAEELLKNTVLYKVSHHGSHNATVKDKGLEMMTHPDLVAMIPEKEKSYNGILYKPLIKELDKRCKGRVIISADVKFPPEQLLKKRPPELSAAEWKAFKEDLTVEPLYVEYTVR